MFYGKQPLLISETSKFISFQVLVYIQVNAAVMDTSIRNSIWASIYKDDI